MPILVPPSGSMINLWMELDRGAGITISKVSVCFQHWCPIFSTSALPVNKGFMIAEQDLFSLQTLTRLQTLRLKIASNGQWDLNTLSPLQHLTALEQLDMDVRGFGACPMLLAPELSKLNLLTTLSLKQRCSPHHDIVCDS